MLIFLTLVDDEAPFAELQQNLSEQVRAFRHLALRGAECIAVGYNQLAREAGAAPDDVLCFIHQDARLYFDASVQVPRYLERLPAAGILGFCGSAAQQPGRQWHQCPPCYGGLLQGGENPVPLRFGAPAMVRDGLHYMEVQTLDGYCLFVRQAVFEQLGGFDEEYGGWHAYDSDLCLQAQDHGFRNYVIDQPSQHYSWGSGGEALGRALALFERKWGTRLLQGEPRLRIHVYGLARDAAVHVERFVAACAGADGIHLLDTGSSDDTAARLRAHGIHVEVAAVLPWRCDVARNRSLALVPPDADVCVAVDLDEVLVAGWRQLVEDAWAPETTRLDHLLAERSPSGAPARETRASRCHARNSHVWRGLVAECLTPSHGAEAPVPMLDRALIERGAGGSVAQPGGEALAQALLALERDPYDEALAGTYRRLQELTATAIDLTAPPAVDVIVLAYCASEREYAMTRDCIRSLRASSPEVALHVVVVETNAALPAAPFVQQEAELFAPGVTVVYPGGRFGYNSFLAAGYAACAGSPARQLLILNNDVVLFGSGFLQQLQAGLRVVDSVSPLGLREAQWGLVDRTQALDVNFDINKALCGWCLMFDKRILAGARFEAYFPPHLVWYGQDEHYAATLAAHGFRHGQVTAAKALHLQASSHRFLGHTLAPPTDRGGLLQALGIRHKRCAHVGAEADGIASEILALEPALLLLAGSRAAAGAALAADPRVQFADAADAADVGFEFVYVEPRAAERGLAAELHSWWPRLRPGGWLAGSDHRKGDVSAALEVFCAEHAVRLAFVTPDASASWAIQVPV